MKCTQWSFLGAEGASCSVGGGFLITPISYGHRDAHTQHFPPTPWTPLTPSQPTPSEQCQPARIGLIMPGIYCTGWISSKHFCLYPASLFCLCLLKRLYPKSDFLLNQLHTIHVYCSPLPLQPSFLFSSKFTIFVTSHPRDTQLCHISLFFPSYSQSSPFPPLIRSTLSPPSNPLPFLMPFLWPWSDLLLYLSFVSHLIQCCPFPWLHLTINDWLMSVSFSTQDSQVAQLILLQYW